MSRNKSLRQHPSHFLDFAIYKRPRELHRNNLSKLRILIGFLAICSLIFPLTHVSFGQHLIVRILTSHHLRFKKSEGSHSWLGSWYVCIGWVKFCGLSVQNGNCKIRMEERQHWEKQPRTPTDLYVSFMEMALCWGIVYTNVGCELTAIYLFWPVVTALYRLPT